MSAESVHVEPGWTGIRDRIAFWVGQYPLRALALVVFVGSILGTGNLLVHPPDVEFSQVNLWWEIALNLAHGRGYVGCAPAYFPFCGPDNQITAAREPLPVVLFGAVAWLTNDSLLAASLVMLLTNLAIIISVYYLARELAGTRTALLAALFWACYLPAIRLFYAQASGDLLAALALTLSLRCALRARTAGRWYQWAAAGFWLGVGVLSRSSLLAAAPVLVASALPWPGSTTARTLPRWLIRAGHAGLCAFTLILVLAPWALRNYNVFGRPVLTSTLAGYNLYRANYLLPNDDYLHFVASDEAAEARDALLRRHPELRGTENEAQMDAIYTKEALGIIRAYPGRYLEASAQRFLMLWFDQTVSEAYGMTQTVGDLLQSLQQGCLLAAGFVGLRGRWRRAWPVAATIGAVSLSYILVIARLRYVVPLMPLVVVLSALGCAAIGVFILNKTYPLTSTPSLLNEEEHGGEATTPAPKAV
jgi:4-amino-4-deoxy-L-arabinose transferase-like glycosyltransferase